MSNEPQPSDDKLDIAQPLYAELEADVENADPLELSLLILQAVHRGSHSGEALIRDFLCGAGQAARIPKGFYYALHQLVRDGLLERRMVGVDTSSVDASLCKFELTSLGRAALGL